MRCRLVSGLTAISLATVAACADTQGAQFLQEITWPEPQHQSGGFSAVEVTEAGSSLILISDRGEALYVAATREGTQIKDLVVTQRRWLEPKATEKHETDSEGLAVRPDGAILVSFESDHRVARYGADGVATRLNGDEIFAGLPANGGLEALAIDAQGRLVTLPERSGRLNRDFPIWRHDGDSWQQIGSLPRTGGFSPVGADFGPDGRLYVLERAFTGFGFRSRIRSLQLEESVQDLRQELITPLGRFGNLEGLAVWQDDSGALRLTMIADNNFAQFLTTQIVEYSLPLPAQ